MTTTPHSTAQEHRPPTWKAPIRMLVFRTIAFLVLQTVFILSLGMSWGKSVGWWPFQIIFTNIACFFIIDQLAKQEDENGSFARLIGFQPAAFKKDLVSAVPLLVLGILLGSGWMYLSALLMYGTWALPSTLIQPLPLYAAIVTIVLYPLTTAFAETPTYFGYCFPRIESLSGRRWLAFALTAGFFVIQQIVLPLAVGHVKFMVWHVVSMIPLALLFGFVWMRTRKLVPIMVVHFLLSLQLAVSILSASLR